MAAARGAQVISDEADCVLRAETSWLQIKRESLSIRHSHYVDGQTDFRRRTPVFELGQLVHRFKFERAVFYLHDV